MGICNHLYRVGPYLGQCKCYAPIYRTDHIVPKKFLFIQIVTIS